MRMNWSAVAGLMLLVSAQGADAAGSNPKLAVLEFELNDLTLKPRTPEELKRTASLAPMLRDALSQTYRFTLVSIPPEIRAEADAGFGYLYSHPDTAAELGARYGVDWLVVGRLHKPSFLFAYLQVRLVDVAKKTVVRDSLVEVKGDLRRLNQRGIEHVAAQINETLRPTAGATPGPTP